MGLLSVITGNIPAPGSEEAKSTHTATAANGNGTSGLGRSDTVKTSGTAHTARTSGTTGTQGAAAAAPSIKAASVVQPHDSVSNGHGDAATMTTATSGGAAADVDPAVIGAGAGAGAAAALAVAHQQHGDQTASRPPLGDEQPSRSYIKRSPSVATNGGGSTATGTVVMPRDFATLSPSNAGIPPNDGAVLSLPAGGAIGGQPSQTANGYPNEKAQYIAPQQQQQQSQAYGQDGRPTSYQPSEAPSRQYAQYAAPAAVGAAGGLAAGEAFRQQQQQQQQPHINDPSFAQERAMSPMPPTQAMSRLSFEEHSPSALAAAGGAPGPSPGPAVQPIGTGAYPQRNATTATNPGGAGLSRGNTYRSTLSRGSTLRKGGAFANGAALQGQGVSEAFSRDDIHERTEIADRALAGTPKTGMAKITKAEKKDAKRLSKMIIKEAKSEAEAVKGAIRELESLQKVQKAAIAEELKAQKKHTKANSVEHKARLRFLKEKERYERVEAELRNRESDYEAKREHSQNQTNLLAEKTQELNDLRAQKAADDRERELKLVQLKNPGHA